MAQIFLKLDTEAFANGLPPSKHHSEIMTCRVYPLDCL